MVDQGKYLINLFMTCASFRNSALFSTKKPTFDTNCNWVPTSVLKVGTWANDWLLHHTYIFPWLRQMYRYLLNEYSNSQHWINHDFANHEYIIVVLQDNIQWDYEIVRNLLSVIYPLLVKFWILGTTAVGSSRSYDGCQSGKLQSLRGLDKITHLKCLL